MKSRNSIYHEFGGLFVALALASSGCAAVELNGIAQFSGRKTAIIHAQMGQTKGVWYFLHEGEREGDLAVLSIDPESGKVRINIQGEGISELTFGLDTPMGTLIHPGSTPQTGTNNHPAYLRLQGASPAQVFGLYEDLAQRTLIRSSSLPAFKLSVYCDQPVTTSDLVGGLEKALAEQEIFLTSEGDKFVIVGPKGADARITPAVRQFPYTIFPGTNVAMSPGAQTPTSPAEEILPAGVINFLQTDLNQVLMILQELINRTLLRPATLPASTMILRTCTPLSKREAIFAFTASLAMNGLTVRAIDDKFVFICPTLQTNKLEALLARKTLVQALNNRPAEEIIFSGAPLSALLNTYSQLYGQQIEDPVIPSRTRFVFRTQTPLTKPEALHAFDLLLGWEGLGVVPKEGGKGLKLIRLD